MKHKVTWTTTESQVFNKMMDLPIGDATRTHEHTFDNRKDAKLFAASLKRSGLEPTVEEVEQ